MTASFVETLADRQEEARRRFAESGFPTLRDEAWRFTDISPIAKARFTAAPEGKLTAGAIAPYAFGNDEGIRITFVNGRPSLSLSRSHGRPKGAVILPLSEAQKYPEHAARIEATMLGRMEKVLALALVHGHEVLVLGAWGCGVFANDPAQVAGWFARLLGGEGPYRRAFRRVCFAVLDRTPARGAIGPFERCFSAS